LTITRASFCELIQDKQEKPAGPPLADLCGNAEFGEAS
jgi:hypothetical protein